MRVEESFVDWWRRQTELKIQSKMKGSLKRSRNQHSDKKRGKTNVDLSEKKVVAFDDEEEEIERLNKRIVDEAPASGTQPRR